MLKERQSCKAKNNGSVIDCELGNPLPRDAQVSTAAQFCHCEHQGSYCHNIFLYKSPAGHLLYHTHNKPHLAEHQGRQRHSAAYDVRRLWQFTSVSGCFLIWFLHDFLLTQDKWAAHSASPGIGQSCFWAGDACIWVGVWFFFSINVFWNISIPLIHFSKCLALAQLYVYTNLGVLYNLFSDLYLSSDFSGVDLHKTA